ncbi:uncharacterized protein ALTATR162_LOCUS3104 [Alternaria atra]|uniref:Uncharacterized protein n=1 Tax=Alternaria atra TaxID=119953 RepID=A0A8J2MY01_9PLEO|nr:uncharacterized protein ALTATR162_LOCUS3104 [Alternaria atra]CAG5153266.1 unnamed protein product [Alternaria atra]
MRRIGFVAAASFYHSTFLPYSRPFFANYPNDTITSYRSEYQEGILDPKRVVLVALDDPKDNKPDSVYDALKKIYPQKPTGTDDDDGKVIVGIVSMSLEFDPKPHGQFQPEGEDPPEPHADPEGRKRDAFPDALKLVDKALKDPEEKHVLHSLEC